MFLRSNQSAGFSVFPYDRLSSINATVPVLQSNPPMLSGLKRLRILSPLAIWLAVCQPVPAQVLRLGGGHAGGAAPCHTGAAEAGPGTTPRAGDWARERVAPSFAAVRSVDVDADGDLDLVAANGARVRTWLNLGRGHFVEQAPTRTILRQHSAPGWVTGAHSLRFEDAALSTERPAILPNTAELITAEVCGDGIREVSVSLVSRRFSTGGTRAPPSADRV